MSDIVYSTHRPMMLVRFRDKPYMGDCSEWRIRMDTAWDQAMSHFGLLKHFSMLDGDEDE